MWEENDSSGSMTILTSYTLQVVSEFRRYMLKLESLLRLDCFAHECIQFWQHLFGETESEGRLHQGKM